MIEFWLGTINANVVDWSAFLPIFRVGILSLIPVIVLLLLVDRSSLKLSVALPQPINGSLSELTSAKAANLYHKVVQPYQQWLLWTLLWMAIDLSLITFSKPNWLALGEFLLGLQVVVNLPWLDFKLMTQLFDGYLLEIALEDGSKVNSELLTLAEFLTKAAIALIGIFLFAQTHQINLIGLIASLGIGGMAITFASQKVIEQILWSTV